MISFLSTVLVISGFYQGCTGIVKELHTYPGKQIVYQVEVSCAHGNQHAKRGGLWFKESELKVKEDAKSN